MTLSTLDWIIVFSYFTLSLFIGVWASKQAGQDTKSFFLAGRNMPWWSPTMVGTKLTQSPPPPQALSVAGERMPSGPEGPLWGAGPWLGLSPRKLGAGNEVRSDSRAAAPSQQPGDASSQSS